MRPCYLFCKHFKILVMRAIKRFELIELIIPAGSTAIKFQYPDIPQLRDDTTQDILVRGLRGYSIETMPLSPTGNPVATTAQLQNSFLILYIEQEESIYQLPMIELNTIFQALATGTSQQVFEPTELQDLKIDWNKSYIQTAAPYNNEADFSIMLGVTYKKLPPGTWDSLTKNAIKGM